MKSAISFLLFILLDALPPPLAFADTNIPSAGGKDIKFCETSLQFDREPIGLRGFVTANVALSAPHLLQAYRRGLFPWGMAQDGLGEWYNPKVRGVLDLDQVHISRKDMKFIRRHLNSPHYRVTFDQAFPQVIRACAEMKRFARDPVSGLKIPAGKWISPEFVDTYIQLYDLGYAHSVEVWHDERLVGGLYGVFVDGIFTGESMFHKEADVTKLAFYKLIERLHQRGHRFIDTQMTVGLAGKWGARYVPREDFMKLLAAAHERPLDF